MNSKFGMFSVLIIGVMMLLIPSTSIANAQQEYEDKYYEDEQYEKIDKKSYNESYKKDDEGKSNYSDDDDKYKKDVKEKSEEPIIIIKNEPIQKKEKKKMMKEPPMLVVKKDVLYCDDIVNNVAPFTCDIESDILGPDSGSYIQDCGNDEFVCDIIHESSFDMIVTDNIEFPGSEDGKKINFNGERYTVTEEFNLGIEEPNSFRNSQCQEAGFDGSLDIFLFGTDIEICTIFEGECSGIVQDGELKECTIKNYLVDLDR